MGLNHKTTAHCIVVCCSVLQWIVLQCVAVCCSVLQCVAARDSLFWTGKWQCSRCSSRNIKTLQHTATHCNTLQHTATHCNTLQCNPLSFYGSNPLKRSLEPMNLFKPMNLLHALCEMASSLYKQNCVHTCAHVNVHVYTRCFPLKFVHSKENKHLKFLTIMWKISGIQQRA